MRLGEAGAQARNWTDKAGDAVRLAGQATGEGLDKTGKTLKHAGQATMHASLHPKETANNAGQAIARKGRSVSDHAKALGREIESRKFIPEGMPKPPIGGKVGRLLDKDPVGPNAFEAMSKSERKGKSPNYPVQYSIPATSEGNGIHATGRMAGFTTGPGLLPQQYRVPGKFNYDEIPNLVVTPHRERDIQKLQHAETYLMDEGATSLQRVGRNGLPANPDTGMPVLPGIPDGSFTLTAQTPMPRRPSEFSLDSPTRIRPRDPYALDESDSRPGTAG
jgi:hypothetical protein